MNGRGWVLLAGVVTAIVLAAGVTIAVSGVGPGSRPTPAAPTATSPAERSEPETPTATPPGPEATAILTDPEVAEEAGADAVMDAALELARGPWAELGDPAWPVEVRRPVYVGRVQLGDDLDTVDADLVVATPVEPSMDQIVLRLLPAATALGESPDLTADVRADGRRVPATVDRAGARLVVDPTPEMTEDGAVLLRIDLSYALVPMTEILDDGGPAGFGLLARFDDLSTLGHWLPVLALPGDDGAMVPWGDVGAFPVAVWSLLVETEDELVTGGVESPCPGEQTGCVWGRGIALRDVSAVAFEAGTTASVSRDGHRVVAPSALGGMEGVLDEALAAAESFEQRFGPLAWSQVDTVAVPLGIGAAGMEFPGLSMVDDDVWGALDGELGTFVIAHEVAHQWFHALVGNGSLSSPVVDESLAQYLSYLYYLDAFGAETAHAFAERRFYDRYSAAVAGGLQPAPPARPLAEFEGQDTYGPLVYGRAATAWIEAEQELGRDRVVAFLQQVVERHGLGEVSDDRLLDEATAFDPRLGAILEEVWFETGEIASP